MAVVQMAILHLRAYCLMPDPLPMPRQVTARLRLVGWSGLFRQLVGEFKVDSATSLNYRPRRLYRNSLPSSSRLFLVPYLCCG